MDLASIEAELAKLEASQSGDDNEAKEAVEFSVKVGL